MRPTLSVMFGMGRDIWRISPTPKKRKKIMADYQLQLPGADIDARLAAVPNKQDTLVSGTNIKTINNESILGSGNITIEGGGVGFDSVSSQQDGTLVITLTSGDTITIDLNHNHSQYPKYVYLTSESQMPASPDSTTMYLIKE